MKTVCIVCNKEFIPDTEDMKRIVTTVERHGFGTTVILDMLTPLAGICNEETDDYHILAFDSEEVEQLKELGSEHLTLKMKLNFDKNDYEVASKRISEFKVRLQELIKRNKERQDVIVEVDRLIEKILDKCEEITTSRRIELWQVEGEKIPGDF
jgi:hypothetical protein